MEETQALTEIRKRFPHAVREAFRATGDDVWIVEKSFLFRVAEALKDRALDYALLLDLTCVDYLQSRRCFEMVYSFYSISRNHRLRLKVEIPAEESSLASLTPLWKNADWLEREVYDLFGLEFEGHPDLRRLFLYESFKGYPLRKDYPLRRRQEIIPLGKKS